MKEGWQIKKLGDVCSIVNGGTPSTSVSTYWDGGVQWLTPKDMGGLTSKYVDKGERTISQEGVEHSSAKVLPTQSVIISSRAPIGYVAINIVPMATNQGCKGIVPTKEIQSEYLYYFLIKSNDLLNRLGTGATFKELSGGKLADITIPIPSLSEQQRIVSLLDAEFAKIDTLKANAERNLQNAKDLFQAALKKELESKEGWGRKKLNDLYDVRDGTHDSPKYQATGYPLVTSKNLRNGIVDMTNVKYISQHDYDKINERSKVDVGDVLFAMIGTIGNPSLVVEEPNYAIKNMALFKVPSNQSGSLLRYVLSSNQVLDEMHNKAKGSNQPFVSLGYLRNFEITIPQTLEEQNSLVCKLDTLDGRCKTLQANYEKTIVLCDDLKQALLRKAFNGEL
ncbi:MAG: restriction endonuclease subunit S [Bacteroidales bacterium]|nr:restriction endonuclease subunit S [Bacteroidales bacterium]MBR4582488.1 restriction endonuclease subunit S [Bacteroidales bacterium]